MHYHHQVSSDVLVQSPSETIAREYQVVPVVVIGALVNAVVPTIDQLGTGTEEKVKLHDNDKVEENVSTLRVGEDILAENS